MKIEIIKCLQDNYSYLIIDEENQTACVIDPSESVPIINYLDNSKINLKENKLTISFREKFNFRRGRINCSLNDIDGWRWLGSQFSVDLN